MALLAHQKIGIITLNVLLSLNIKMSETDPSFIYYYYNDELQGIIANHIDDFLLSGNQYFLKNIISKLHNEFILRKIYDTGFCFFRAGYEKNENFIFLDQTHYISSLNTVIHYFMLI